MNKLSQIARNQQEKPLRALLFDIAEQREIIVDSFKIAIASGENNRRIHYYSEQYGLIIPLIIEQSDENNYRVMIAAGTIIEQYSIRYRLMRLAVMPYLLETSTGDSGAFMLPVFSGMLVDFRERPHCVNADRIYMEQREWEKFSMMNCFGCFSSSGNVLGIIESGDFSCRVISEYNDQGKNRIYAEFQLRENHVDMIKCEDYTVLFKLMPPSPHYDEPAKAYRDYLLRRGASFLKERMINNPELAYSVEALRVKIFMAAKKPQPDGKGPITVYTTCDEACRMIDEMIAAGIGKATLTLVGWNLGGHDGAYPTRLPVEPAIGGEDGLRNLIAYAKKHGYKIVPHDNVTDIYRGSPDFDYEYAARDAGQEPVAAGLWSGGQSYKACPMVYLQRYGYEFDRIRKLGFEGHYYLDAQSTVLWRCFSPRHPADEKEFAMALSAITTIPRVQYGAVSIECANVYSLPFIDEVSTIHTPILEPKVLANCPESFRRLKPYAIPFFHIALHGLILYQGRWVHNYKDPEKSQLGEIALGARPSMEISWRSGSNGDDFRNSLRLLKNAYKWCFNDLNTQSELIESFREPVPGIYETTFANGTEIRVNTTDSPYGSLAARSWEHLN